MKWTSCPAPRQLVPELRRDDARPAERGIAGDADLHQPRSKPSKAATGSSSRGGTRERKPSAYGDAAIRPNACARAVTPSRNPFDETYVSGSDEPASWNWLRNARSGLELRLERRRHVDEERRLGDERGRVVDDLLRPVRRDRRVVERLQPRVERRLGHEAGRPDVVGVPVDSAAARGRAAGARRRTTSITSSSAARSVRRSPSPRSSVARRAAPRMPRRLGAPPRRASRACPASRPRRASGRDAEPVAAAREGHERPAATQLEVVGMRPERQDVDAGRHGVTAHSGITCSPGTSQRSPCFSGPTRPLPPEAEEPRRRRVDALGERPSRERSPRRDAGAAGRSSLVGAAGRLRGLLLELFEGEGDVLPRRRRAPCPSAGSTARSSGPSGSSAARAAPLHLADAVERPARPACSAPSGGAPSLPRGRPRAGGRASRAPAGPAAGAGATIGRGTTTGGTIPAHAKSGKLCAQYAISAGPRIDAATG